LGFGEVSGRFRGNQELNSVAVSARCPEALDWTGLETDIAAWLDWTGLDTNIAGLDTNIAAAVV